MQLEKLWKLVLEDLQVTLSAPNFSMWIKPIQLTLMTEVEGGRWIADLDCPSSFHISIVEQRFYGQIKEAFDRVAGGLVELRFTVNTTLPVPTNSGPLFQFQDNQFNEAEVAIHRLGLREDFSFESFAVSSSNDMAHAAAVAVSENLAGAYNPLFLYGGVGVGKTHLMQAIARAALLENPESKFIYCAGEEFTNEIIGAIQQKTTAAFKHKYRSVKGLFIDDIQFIAGKTTVQEEFFHTFNAILKAGGQVVMTSDRPPHEIRELEARLRSRFEAGLIVDIGDPNFELRTAILLIKAKQRALQLTMEDAQMIAANIESARQIEGFLVRLLTEAKLKRRVIDGPLIQTLLGKSGLPQDNVPPPIRPLEIVRGVSEFFGLPTKQVRGPGRSKTLVTPRHISMYLLRVDYGLPLEEIGGIFSNRDHTTVMHAVDKITQELTSSEQLRTDVASVRQHVYK